MPPDLAALRLEQLDLLLRNAREYAIFMMDPAGTIVLWNEGAEALLGWSEQEAVGQPGALIFTDEQREAGVPEAEMATAARDGQAEDQRWHRRKDGSLFWANGMMIALRNGPDGRGGDLRGLAKILRDDTQAKTYRDQLETLNRTLEARVEERTAQVRALADALAEAEAEERRRLSTLLHDDLQQQLYAIRLITGQLVKDLDDGLPAAGLVGRAQQIGSWTGDALALTRRLAADLLVADAPDGRLPDALQALVQHLGALHGLRVDLDLDPEADVPDAGVRSLLVRAVRELLFNVVKHAGVERASIATRHLGAAVEVRVEDEGRGFDPEAADRKTLGLAGIRHRMGLLGGRVDVDARPGQGCQIRLVVPHRPEGPSAGAPHPAEREATPWTEGEAPRRIERDLDPVEGPGDGELEE